MLRGFNSLSATYWCNCPNHEGRGSPDKAFSAVLILQTPTHLIRTDVQNLLCRSRAPHCTGGDTRSTRPAIRHVTCYKQNAQRHLYDANRLKGDTKFLRTVCDKRWSIRARRFVNCRIPCDTSSCVVASKSIRRVNGPYQVVGSNRRPRTCMYTDVSTIQKRTVKNSHWPRVCNLRITLVSQRKKLYSIQNDHACPDFISEKEKKKSVFTAFWSNSQNVPYVLFPMAFWHHVVHCSVRRGATLPAASSCNEGFV